MLRIIEGGFNTLLDERGEALIKAAIKERARAFLIVPEQQTLTSEKWAVENLPSDAPLTFEVTNFTRLADTAFRVLGGLSRERLTSSKRALVMWRVLSELSPFLSATSHVAVISAAMVEKQLRALGEAQALAIGADELLEVADKAIGEGRLGKKATDLAKIMALYERILGEKYTDGARELTLLLEKLKGAPEYLADAEIIIKDFTSFTEEQHKIITELAKRSSVSVLLRLPSGGRELFEFTELRKTAERLRRDAAAAGVRVTLEKAEMNTASAKPLLDETLMLLWRSNGEIDNDYLQKSDELRIFEARDPYEECDFIASDIAARVMAGERYSDFAVLTRSTDSYLDVLERAFSAAGVPIFISKKRDVASFEAIKLIYTAFAVALGGFARRDVITYAKCSLSGIDRKRCDELELYTEKWQITGRRFTDGIAWNMNPDGYTDRYRAGSDELLIRIDETRRALVEPLLEFTEEVAKAKTVLDYAESLVRLLCRIGLESALKSRCRELEALGEHAAAEQTRGLWRMICDTLDAVVEVLGGSEVSAESFLEILKTAFSAVDIGRIPAFTDEVLAGGADMLRPTGKKHVYLIGVNYGLFPYAGTTDTYFTERERTVLRSLGLMIESQSEIDSARELFYFSRAFAAASTSVTLSYPTHDASFKALERADVIGRLGEISGGVIMPRRISDIPARDRISTPEQALSLLDEAGEDTDSVREALERAGYGEELLVSERSAVNSDLRLSSIATGALYREDMALTQARIDSFISCPLGYFCRYNLALSENERAQFNVMNVGTFIHAILEQFFISVKNMGLSLSEVDAQTKRNIVETVSKKHLAAMTGGDVREARLSVMTGRLMRAAMPVVDSLCREFSACAFEPKFFELKIGGDESLPAPASFDIPGGVARVYGTIDRVDTFKSGDDVYVRVVDYKTGKKVFSPSDINEGRNLQMLLYLKAITDTDKEGFKQKTGVSGEGRLIPAAIVYTHASIADVKTDAPGEERENAAVMAAQTVSGMMLRDEKALAAMNPDFLPVPLKNGHFGDTGDARIFTLDGWSELSKTLSEVVSKIATEMRGGDISARPIKQKGRKSQCEYCAYKPICRNALSADAKAN